MKVKKTITINRAVCEAIELNCGPKEFSSEVEKLVKIGLGMVESGSVEDRIGRLERGFAKIKNSLGDPSAFSYVKTCLTSR